MDAKKISKEIDVIGLVKMVLSERALLFKFCAIFAIIGVIIAINTPKKYTSTVVLAPEATDASGLSSKMGSFTSLLGINIGSALGSDAFYPEIYPEIFGSTDFIIGLFDIPVTISKTKEEKTYYDHILYDAHIPFWSYPFEWIKNTFNKDDEDEGIGTNNGINPFRLTNAQYGICNAIMGRISCTVDKKTDVISISVTDYDKLVCATMADSVTARLQDFLTTYRTRKAKNDYEYTLGLYNKAKEDYNKACRDYAIFSDANKNISLETYKVKQDILENEMQLKHTIYTQISALLQSSQAKIQERTPSFTTIQAATVPLKASSFPRSYMVILYIILGIIIDSLWVCFLREPVKELISNHRAKKNNKQ